jgi:hypothetical protein
MHAAPRARTPASPHPFSPSPYSAFDLAPFFDFVLRSTCVCLALDYLSRIMDARGVVMRKG